jgi:hypothetical protein
MTDSATLNASGAIDVMQPPDCSSMPPAATTAITRKNLDFDMKRRLHMYRYAEPPKRGVFPTVRFGEHAAAEARAPYPIGATGPSQRAV